MEHNEGAVVADTALVVAPSRPWPGAPSQYPEEPIHRLPAEMLLHIFTDVAPLCTEPFYAWISITHVCTRWRQIALASPKLWTDIQITLSKNTHHMADLFIQRSLDRKLKVIVYLEFDLDSSISESALEEDCTYIIDTVVKLSPRIERLTLTIDAESDDLPRSILKEGQSPDFSHLTFLELTNKTHFEYPSAESTLSALVPDSCSLPRLETLVTSLDPQTYLRWCVPSLKTLRIHCPKDLSYPDLNKVLSALSGLEKLETLMLEDFQLDHFNPHEINGITNAVMPKLRWLKATFSKITWRAPASLCRLDVSPARLTIELGSKRYTPWLLDKSDVIEVHALMQLIAAKIREIICRDAVPLRAMRMQMSYHNDWPKLSICAFRSESPDDGDEPALDLGIYSLYTAKPFLYGAMHQLPLRHLTNLHVSSQFIPHGSFHGINVTVWRNAMVYMYSLHTVTFSGSPPLSLISALQLPPRPLPALRTIHLKNVDFRFLEDLGLSVWGPAFKCMLRHRAEDREGSSIRVEHLWIDDAINFTEVDAQDCDKFVDVLH